MTSPRFSVDSVSGPLYALLMARCPAWNRLRPYQQAATDQLVVGSGGLFVFAGAGKTAIALAAAFERDAFPLLVVTRAVGRHAWVRDALWVLEEPCAELWAGAAKGAGVHRDGSYSSLERALRAARVVVTNYDILPKRIAELCAVRWGGLILDECHEVKMGYQPAKVHEATKKIKPRRFELAAALADSVRPRGPVWGLTATPIRSCVRDLWGQLHILRPQDHPIRGGRNQSARGRWDWLHYYTAARRSDWGGLDTTGSDHLEDLAAYLRKNFVILDRTAVVNELPRLQRDMVLVEPDWTKKGVSLGGGHEGAIATAASMKVDSVLELAMGYLADGLKVVIVVSRRALAVQLGAAVRQAIQRELAQRVQNALWCETTTGDTDVRDRARLCAEFQAWQGPAVLSATYDSVQTSMDLHQASALIFAALPSTPFGLHQMEGRVGRLGGVPATVHYVIAKGTIDERIKKILLDRLNIVEEVGVDTVRGDSVATLAGSVSEEEVLAGLRSWLEENPE